MKTNIPPPDASALKTGDRVAITNPQYEEVGSIGVLEIQDVDGADCWHVRFADGTALGVGEDDVRRA